MGTVRAEIYPFYQTTSKHFADDFNGNKLSPRSQDPTTGRDSKDINVFGTSYLVVNDFNCDDCDDNDDLNEGNEDDLYDVVVAGNIEDADVYHEDEVEESLAFRAQDLDVEKQLDDNCVDVSKYGDITYNTEMYETCTYRIRQSCEVRRDTVCINVPRLSCQVVGGTECTKAVFTNAFQDDQVHTLEFVPKDCVQDRSRALLEVRKVPVCKNVTTQECDTKWEVNDAGEKVWAGNENCRDRTYEDCFLEEVLNEIQVPTYTCYDGASVFYTEPEFRTVEAEGYKTACRPTASPMCISSEVEECTEVEWEDCTDVIEPMCTSGMTRIPHQEYDHVLKCIGL